MPTHDKKQDNAQTNEPPHPHYDPRLGDEESEETRTEQPQRHVRIQVPTWTSHPVHDEKVHQFREKRRAFSEQLRSVGAFVVKNFPLDLQWIPNNWTWSKWKPVIRSAILGWLSILFMVITRLEEVTGQATFLILISAFLDPPRDPFIAVLERELVFSAFVTMAWAWSCLGIFLANLARTNTDHNAPLTSILTGQYIQAAPTVIIAVFIFFGVAFFLFVKARQGPGPFLFPSVFGSICIDISLVTAVLFPYPYYDIGRAIVLPLVFHSGLCIVCAAFIFPSTITAQYAGAISRLMDPLEIALNEHRTALKTSPSHPQFIETVKKITDLVGKAEGGLVPAAAALRLVKHDILWGRFAPTDVGGLQEFIRRLVTRANGLGTFFTLIEPTRERFPVTPLPSKPSTPSGSRVVSPSNSRPETPFASRPASPTRGNSTPPRGNIAPTSSFPRFDSVVSTNTQTTSRAPSPEREERGRVRHRHRHRKHLSSVSSLRLSISQHLGHLGNRLKRHEEDTQSERLHFSLLHLAHNLSLPPASSSETAVAVFESQRYLTLEATRLSHPDSPEFTEHFVVLLNESCDELLGVCAETIRSVKGWIMRVRQGSFAMPRTIEQMRAEHLAHLTQTKENIKLALERFRNDYRHRVLDPYRSAFDPSHVRSPGGSTEPPPHRYLFHCYVYQYHLIRFASIIIEILDEMIRLEENYKKSRLWMPMLPFKKLIDLNAYDTTALEQNDDEDPERIPGIEPEWEEDLGMASRRNPDALPPRNLFEQVMSWIHDLIQALAGGNSLFALKAGLLTIILCIPSFLRRSAAFAYDERFVWGIFMGQLTLARFRGDTTFGLVARLVSTFLGSVVGLVLWYISAGKGHGNPYGFAATFGVCFPAFYFGRLYWPGPPMVNAIFFVTVALVLGFSWQNTHYPLIFHFYGWSLAWRRFVLVTAGVTAAFLFSFLPPSTTLRRYQRTMLSRTVAELGAVYCSIVSFANTRGRHEVNRDEIVRALVAIRMKLKRSIVLRNNIIYEFSLRGRWPSKRYQRILELQIQTAFLLGQLMSVVEHLDHAWSRAFLRRTRLLDADFQGDVLAVISMVSTALRTGNPLPQITPCPLVDRFMAYTHGLNVIRQEADDDYGLPRTMTIDTLENEQYLTFAVGVTTAFGIILRLDKLMVATKELVGEQYHIHGIGAPDPRVYSTDRPAKDA
ncbi:uncharacterized protein LAESUDRAFT_523085 [Laetiporus sulphureus 93-53]|uniref:ER transporter 6TM N-terminal domain-containing protein n=1 Tax=Laetiporus sulphureus 93-53 TaxID=1314785 RepID=A0A165BEZ5_9APHY|nr:uncharacterized protein LAESUDRAFT_523085 [Laetiporus sulphureus 93-53]KZT00914.1 hypothetical protein LAESUDRAFT_523085 [Laetiporus sulphureus 93-53]